MSSLMRNGFLVLCLSVPASAQERVDFNFDVKPILSDRCFACHGPDAENRAADLRLDTREGAFAKSESGEVDFVIRPGDPARSELIRRITSTDPDVRMPPPDSKLSLTADEIDTVKKWVREGAEWRDHWSFIPLPKEVPVPQVDGAWPRNKIDHFVMQRLREAGMQPQSEAGKERLLRRVTFDLTGLPPTTEEVDAFLEDSSADAWERVVDRLLASEAYGERMASEWLDVARYSDTYGYQVDRDRYVWPWRDWVIKAFNRNLSYRDFVTQQLAGDLLPEAGQEQVLATTFNRLHPQKVEGGSVPEEFRVEYVADRTQTFATAFLGLTLECARCHDHKYDPIEQKEYYELFAFFNNIDEAGLYSYFTPAVPTPTLLLTEGGPGKQLAQAKSKVRAAEAELQKSRASSVQRFEKWRAEGGAIEPTGQVAYLNCDQPSGPNTNVPGVVGQALRLTGDDAVGTKVGNFRRFEPFSVSLWMKTPDHKERAVIFHRSRAWTDAGSRGYQLLLEDGRLSASLIHFWPGNAIRVRARRPIPVDEWIHVTVTWDGSSRARGLRLFVNGASEPVDVVRDALTKQITGGGGDHIAIGERFRDNGFKGGSVDEFRVFNRELTAGEARQLAARPDEKPESTTDELREFFLSAVDPASQKAMAALQESRKAQCELYDRITEIMVMRELKSPRSTYVLARGAYDAPAAQVNAETPDVFPSFPDDKPRNRLGLADWLFSENHPLTARVVVNRYWQLLFGEGLVRTPEDFGSQGALPTHPQLLDWLARDFMDSGWDIKRLLKQMVMSATYRQDSSAPEELMRLDPENRLLARFPAYRLPAEMLRDNALAVSDLLVRRIGGPPVRPYEVEVSFKPAKRDKGDGLYRRSLYTYWKRTGPAPVMMTLDASKRDVCRVKRERTSSPLQAFVVLNGPQFVEAARALSDRLLSKHGADQSAVLSSLFRRLTSRHPSPNEAKILAELYERELEGFRADSGRADAYLKQGDYQPKSGADPARLAATTVVANALLGLDEAIMKR